jgi:class 3 adenylate cyclase
MSASRPETGSQRRVVTVLFADVVGFTAMAERLDPEIVTDAMNEVLAALAIPRPYEVAQSQVVWGEAMLATGERDGAIAAWEAAQAAFDLLGAAWDSQRVAEQLAAARGG